MWNKRTCLMHISDAFFHCGFAANSHKNEALWGSVHFLWTRCPSWSSVSLSRSHCLLQFSLSTSCPHSYTITVNGSTDVGGKCWIEIEK